MRVPAARSETSEGRSAVSPARTIVASVGAIGTSKRRRRAPPERSRPFSVDRSSDRQSRRYRGRRPDRRVRRRARWRWRVAREANDLVAWVPRRSINAGNGKPVSSAILLLEPRAASQSLTCAGALPHLVKLRPGLERTLTGRTVSGGLACRLTRLNKDAAHPDH